MVRWTRIMVNFHLRYLLVRISDIESSEHEGNFYTNNPIIVNRFFFCLCYSAENANTNGKKFTIHEYRRIARVILHFNRGSQVINRHGGFWDKMRRRSGIMGRSTTSIRNAFKKYMKRRDIDEIKRSLGVTQFEAAKLKDAWSN